MKNKLKTLLSEIALDVHRISDKRKKELDNIAEVIIQHFEKEKLLEIMVICTHNSRRSQLGEVWINTLAAHFKMNIKAYSGGVEETAFNHRMVQALLTLGFNLDETEGGVNPKYVLKGSKNNGHRMFSKVYNHAMNPQKGFMAFMVCGDADENCPIVEGMKYRIPLLYKDPKAYDGTDLESEAYTEKVKEIGREMYYLLKKVKLTM